MNDCDMRLDVELGDTFRFGAMILIIGAVTRLGASIYLPALPVIGAELSADASMMSQTLSVYFLVFALCTLVAGPLSDTLGRKAVLQSGMLFFILGAILCALARNYETLLLGRVIQALGASMIPGTLMAMIRDASSDARVVSLTGWLAVLGGLLLVGAPLLGGILTHFFGWGSNFWFLALFSSLAWMASLFWMEETHPREARLSFSIRAIFSRLGHMTISAEFILVMLPIIAFFAVQGAFLAAAPYVMMKRYGFTPAQFGLSNAVIVLGIFSGRFIAVRLLKHRSAPSVYRLGGILSFFAVLLFCVMALGWFDNAAVFLIITGFYAALYGMLSPIGLKSALTAFRTSAGTAASLQGALLLGASAMGSALTGLLAKSPLFSIHTAFALLSALFCLTAAFSALSARHRLK